MKVSSKPNPKLPLFDPVNALEQQGRRVAAQRARFLQEEQERLRAQRQETDERRDFWDALKAYVAIHR